MPLCAVSYIRIVILIQKLLILLCVQPQKEMKDDVVQVTLMHVNVCICLINIISIHLE